MSKKRSKKPNVYGEGNYEASRVYNSATRQFVESGRVEEAARRAEPKSPAEADEMKRAEESVALRGKGRVSPEPGENMEQSGATTARHSPDDEERAGAGDQTGADDSDVRPDRDRQLWPRRQPDQRDQ